MMCNSKTGKACGVFAGIGVLAMLVGFTSFIVSTCASQRFDDLFKANATLPDVKPDYLKDLKFKSNLGLGIALGSLGATVLLGGGAGCSLGGTLVSL